MRIISGDLKGRVFNLPRFFKDRPTTDVAREGLFNILTNIYYYDEIRVLDLFAGSGSISLEFASRGCEEVTSVDINQKYTDFIDSTIEKLFPDSYPITTITSDAYRFLEMSSLQYDIIFADPPYDSQEIEKIPDLVINNPDRNKELLLIIEHSKDTRFLNTKYLEKQKRYGKVHFSFFDIK